jgi:hypothetical protein
MYATDINSSVESMLITRWYSDEFCDEAWFERRYNKFLGEVKKFKSSFGLN